MDFPGLYWEIYERFSYILCLDPLLYVVMYDLTCLEMYIYFFRVSGEGVRRGGSAFLFWS